MGANNASSVVNMNMKELVCVMQHVFHLLMRKSSHRKFSHNRGSFEDEVTATDSLSFTEQMVLHIKPNLEN